MTFSPATLKSTLPAEDSVKRFWIALSGGLDSMVLLHAMASLKLSVPVMALHVNHQISSNSDNWQQQCALFCETLQIPFYAEKVAVTHAGRGLEDAARGARYGVFERYLQLGDVLLTAHHADDQAETLLLRLMRGAGPRGLAAIAHQRELGAGQLCRPLLAFSRAELQAYAEAQNLTWVEDESNLNSHYDRNFLRHKAVPILRERWPQLSRRLQQTAELCAVNEGLLIELAAEDLAAADVRMERAGQSISLAALHQRSVARRHNLLRHWLREAELDLPEQSHLVQFQQQIMTGRADAEITLAWGNLTMHRYRERLYVLPRLNSVVQTQEPYDFVLSEAFGQIPLGQGGSLNFEYINQAKDMNCLQANLPDLSLRWREGGERCQPAGRTHSQTLKRLLQEYGLEPWWRAQLPLVFSGETLVAAGDLWVCKDFVAAPGQPGYRLAWQPQLPGCHSPSGS